jgi:hypothetical protein
VCGVSTAAVALIENITKRPHDYARREAEVGPWLVSCGGPGRGRGPVVVAPEDAAGGQPVGPAAALAHGASSPSSTAGAVYALGHAGGGLLVSVKALEQVITHAWPGHPGLARAGLAGAT